MSEIRQPLTVPAADGQAWEHAKAEQVDAALDLTNGQRRYLADPTDEHRAGLEEDLTVFIAKTDAAISAETLLIAHMIPQMDAEQVEFLNRFTGGVDRLAEEKAMAERLLTTVREIGRLGGATS